MTLISRTASFIPLTVACSVFLAACSGSSSNSDDPVNDNSVVPSENTGLALYPADGAALTPRIRRTTAGVPHIDGDSLSEVSAGSGYAQAEDNLCVLADGFLKVRGERAEFLGTGQDNEHVISDFSYRALALRAKAETALPTVSGKTRAMIDGFVAGYNHYLNTSDRSSWPSACRDEAWVRNIDATDMLAYYHWLAILSSGEIFASFGDLLLAVPPGTSPEPTVVSAQGSQTDLTGVMAKRLAKNKTQPWQDREKDTASNAWSIGAELSENGRGALLSNPHFPYSGSLRFYQSHLTVPDELNMMGAGLLGFPIPQIAFNDNVAWTHTTSSSAQFTVYRLSLDPNDPLVYLKDGEPVPITSRTLQIKVANGTDTPTVLEKKVYDSEYGPMLSMSSVTNGALPQWGTDNFAFTYRDATADVNFLDTWAGLATASDLDEFQSVFENCGSTLWTNSIFTDKDGNAFYIDSSAVPDLSTETLAAIDQQLNDNLYADLFANGLVLLDGSTSRDDWVEGDCAGRVPYDKVPKLARTDFVQNSNSSYWTANPAEFLTGYSRLFGTEEQRLNARTRLGLTMLQNPTESGFGESSPAGDDGKFGAQDLLQVIWNNRAFYAELVLPEVRERCNLIGETPVQVEDTEPRSVAGACAVLANWSGNYSSDAVGAHLFRMLLGAGFERGAFFPSIEFDPADPVNTPAGLATENRGEANDPVLQALVIAVQRLEATAIPLSATLGSVQTYTPSGGTAPGGMPFELADALPWHGGNGDLDGAFNAVRPVDSPVQQNTALPRVSPPTIPGTGGLAEAPGVGWRIARGTSFHMGMQFNDDGPEAWGLVSYGQSTNPGLPWYTDQSAAYSSQSPRPLLFKETDIAASVLPDGETRLSIELNQ